MRPGVFLHFRNLEYQSGLLPIPIRCVTHQEKRKSMEGSAVVFDEIIVLGSVRIAENSLLRMLGGHASIGFNAVRQFAPRRIQQEKDDRNSSDEAPFGDPAAGHTRTLVLLVSSYGYHDDFNSDTTSIEGGFVCRRMETCCHFMFRCFERSRGSNFFF